MKNNFIIDKGIVYIKLTKDKIVILDESDMSLIIPHKWYTKDSGNTWYAVTNMQLSSGNIKTLRMHRLLMDLNFGDLREIDHIDGNGLNNCRTNLRIVNRQMNQHNRHQKQLYRGNKSTTSKYPGVCWNKDNKKYRAYIKLNCKSIYLGYFNNEYDAYRAYINAKTIRDFGGSIDQIKSLRQINK